MKFYFEKDGQGILIRLLVMHVEIFYARLGLTGLQAEIEFPSDWHEHRLGWIRIGLGLFKVALAFPWPWTVPDEYQCSGPTYGFHFYEDVLFVRWGKNKGQRTAPQKVFYMPWSWRHQEHKILTEPESYPYAYVLRDGTVQYRIAKIRVETRLWTRPWLPSSLLRKSIDVEFDGEVGERTGTWKGGTLGCSYEMKQDETPLGTLRRMEQERKF